MNQSKQTFRCLSFPSWLRCPHKWREAYFQSCVSSHSSASSWEEHFVYLACSKHTGPPVGVQHISQQRPHIKPLPTALHLLSNPEGYYWRCSTAIKANVRLQHFGGRILSPVWLLFSLIFSFKIIFNISIFFLLLEYNFFLLTYFLSNHLCVHLVVLFSALCQKLKKKKNVKYKIWPHSLSLKGLIVNWLTFNLVNWSMSWEVMSWGAGYTDNGRNRWYFSHYMAHH